MTFRLLALDVDGTLLDPRGELRPAVAKSVRMAQQAGLHVVLCTGRRYRTALPVLEALGLQGPVVLQNGALVKDALSGETSAHSYLARDDYASALAILRKCFAPLVYVDRYAEGVDMVSEPFHQAHPFQAEYCSQNVAVIRLVERLDERGPDDAVMLSCMADEASLEPLRRQLSQALGDRVRINFLINQRYQGHILEVLSKHSGKWPALAALAAGLGIAAREIVAIGDDENDAEMLAGAGLGIAMGNAVAAVLRAADHVVADNERDGVSEAIERFAL